MEYLVKISSEWSEDERRLFIKHIESEIKKLEKLDLRFLLATMGGNEKITVADLEQRRVNSLGDMQIKRDYIRDMPAHFLEANRFNFTQLLEGVNNRVLVSPMWEEEERKQLSDLLKAHRQHVEEGVKNARETILWEAPFFKESAYKIEQIDARIRLIESGSVELLEELRPLLSEYLL